MSMRGVGVVGLLAVVWLAAGCSTSTTGQPRPATPVSSSSGSLPASAGAVLADADVAARAGGAAQEAFQAIDNYDYRTLAASLHAALAVSTGRFAHQYEQTFRAVIEKNAVRLRSVQLSRLTQVAIQQVVSASTVRLLGAGIVRVTQGGGTPRTDTFAAVITMTETGGQWLVSDLDATPQGTTPPAGTPALTAAVTAAGAAFVVATTYARATFDRDYDDALALTTGDLHSSLAARRASLRAEIIKQGVDVRGAVTALGVLDATGTMVRVLIVASITTTTKGTPTTTVAREIVTVIKVDGHWLADDLATVG